MNYINLFKYILAIGIGVATTLHSLGIIDTNTFANASSALAMFGIALPRPKGDAVSGEPTIAIPQVNINLKDPSNETKIKNSDQAIDGRYDSYRNQLREDSTNTNKN